MSQVPQQYIPNQYTGGSIVDYLNSVGQPTDYASRATLAAQKGITGYSGSAEQNTQLLNILRGGSFQNATQSNPASASQLPPQTLPKTQQQSVGQQLGLPQGSPQSIQDLINMGYGGYQGWNNEMSALADYRNTGGTGKWTGGGGTGSGGMGVGLNLPELYKSLYNSSGVSDLEKKLSDMTTAFNAAQSKINDNPFLSEASRVGRIQKLQTDFNNAVAGTQKDIETKKADIEMQLNLQTKQFDIQSQQAQNALDQFNSLLASGALDNANGSDIANITRSTGLSSSVINSAINAHKQSNMTIESKAFDDGVNEGFILYTIDPMGNIVNQSKQITGQSSNPTGKYSSDPKVSNYINSKFNQNSDISTLWDDVS